jgi:hypothetical protein
MTTATLRDIPLDASRPAEHLRQIAAAVRLHFTWWGVHRTLTTQQKEEVGDTCGADARFLTAGKKIIDVRHEAFRRLTSIRTRAGQYWRGLTLPYVEPGVRLIRQTDIDGFVHTVEGFREEISQAEVDLNAVYEQIKSDARTRLGRLYNATDYPPEIRGLFAIDWDFPSVEPPNYLLRLNPELYAQEQQRVALRFEEAVRLAEEAFINEFARLVAHLTERLGNGPDGGGKVFRDSAVHNLVEFFDRFRALSVRSNEQLDALVDQARHIVRGVKPQNLRDNDGLRQRVATELTQVQSTLDGLLVDRPRRRIIRNQPVTNGASRANGH